MSGYRSVPGGPTFTKGQQGISWSWWNLPLGGDLRSILGLPSASEKRGSAVRRRHWARNGFLVHEVRYSRGLQSSGCCEHLANVKLPRETSPSMAGSAIREAPSPRKRNCAVNTRLPPAEQIQVPGDGVEGVEERE